MVSVMESTHDLMDVFAAKMKDFTAEVNDVHMLWLEEIKQAVVKMFTSDFNTEPELMPKTPSQKKSSRRRRVSVGQADSKAKRGLSLSKSRRSNLRRSSGHQAALHAIPESLAAPESDACPEAPDNEPQRKTRRNNAKATRGKQTATSAEDDAFEQEQETETVESLTVSHPVPSVSEPRDTNAAQGDHVDVVVVPDTPPGPPVRTSVRRSIASRRSTASRRSLAALRMSMTQEAVRRASRRSFLKKRAMLSRSSCSSANDDICFDTDSEQVEEVHKEEVIEDVVPSISVSPAPDDEPEETGAAKGEEEEQKPEPVVESTRYTRSKARNTPSDNSTVSVIAKMQTPVKGEAEKKAAGNPSASRFGFKRKVEPADEAPKKKVSPGISQSAVKPNMKSFIHTVQKNQLLMMTPGSAGRSSVMSFIKHNTPGRVDPKERERLKLEAFNKKTAQEVERKKKMEEERKRRNDELKKQRDERVKRVLEARERGAKEDLERRKKLEQKMAQIKEKEEAKKTVASKRQQELELRRKQEEEAKKKKEEEENQRQVELRAKKKAEEEERARKLAEARRQLELKKEQERELERQAAAERERREKALALRMEVERAAREKERRELEERRKREEEEERRRAAAAAAAARDAQLKATTSTTAFLNTTINKGAALNITTDLESTVTKTPVSKAAALFHMSQKNAGLNITLDIERSVVFSPAEKEPEDSRVILLSPNATSDLEKSPQSYEITPKGQKITTLANPEDYGMDQNSDDSTDDESAPKKPIPSWAEGVQLQQAVTKQYYHPVDLLAHFGAVEMPKLETIFHKSKPRYFKRTSSAVWHSPPRMGSLA